MLRYRLTLAGEPLPGHTNESILVALQQQMGLAPAQAEALLPPASHCIKSGLDARELEHWLHAFHQVGLRVHKAPERDAPTALSAPSADPPAALLAAMATGFDRRGISPLYRLQLTLVTLCCVLIPLAYLALVAALGYAWWWYLSHIQLLIGRSLHGFHALALVYAWWLIGDIGTLIGAPHKPAGYGLSLPGIYAVWLAVVVALYPLCRWFAGIKRRRGEWWWSYL